jgi:hypothetical protein
VANTLTPDDLLQRRIDVLGTVQQVSVDTAFANTVTTIFVTGNVAFPASSKYTTILAVIVTSSNGQPFPAGTFVALGASGGHDWLGQATINLGSYTSYPVIIAPQLGQVLGFATMPQYAPGTAFTVNNQSTTPTPGITATFQALGWSF